MQNLRVLFLATRDWYNPQTTGGDNTLWENARYLASVGHDVTYVCASFPGAKHSETIDGIQVVRLGGIHSLWFRTFLFWFSHRRERFDVVVAEGFGGSRIPRLVPLYVRAPIISAWHQIHRELFAAQYPRPLQGPLNLMERSVAWVHRNTFVQAYTEEWKDAFPTLGFKPEKIVVVPVSIREEWLSPNGLGHRAPRVVWIGKLRRYKCAHHAIEAMAGVVEVVPDATLTIVGRHDDPNYEEYLRRLVADLGITNSIDFRFNVTEAEKRALLNEAAVLVVTSAVEGFGIVVLEANASGVPVVASSGVPESVVIDGSNGLRYRFGDIPALAQQIIRLLSDAELSGRLAGYARTNSQQFSWHRVGAEFEKTVRHAAGAPE